MHPFCLLCKFRCDLWLQSVLGRFITFPVIDQQYVARCYFDDWHLTCCVRATANIQTNLTAVGELGNQWNSQPLIDFNATLSKNASNANAGSLKGNRMFYTNDYMVGAFGNWCYHSNIF